jgi:hypothetical protein
MTILELAKQRREAQGLKLQWFIPAENRIFTAFAKDDAQKQVWLTDAEAKGWIMAPERLLKQNVIE